MTTLLLAEHDSKTLKDATSKALTAANGRWAATYTFSSPAKIAKLSPMPPPNSTAFRKC